MPCFWSRKKERERALPTLTASRAMDLGIFFQEYQPRLWLDNVKSRQTEVADPEFSTLFQKQCPGKRCGLSRVLPWRWLGKAGSRDSHGFGSRDSHGFRSRDSHGFRSRDSHGFGSRGSKMQAEVGDVLGCGREEVEILETSRNSTGGEAHQEKVNTHSVIQPPKEEGWDVPRSARMEEKAQEKPGSCQNSGGGKAQQEKVNTHSVIQTPEEEGWDEPSEGCKAWDGDVPGEGNGLGMDQSQPLVQAGASEDEEGRTSKSPKTLECHGEDKDDSTIPGKDGDKEDSEPPSAEGMSGEEQGSQAWEKLGEDTERWEGEPVPDPDVAVSGGERCFLGMLRVCGSRQNPQSSQQDQGDDIPIEIRALLVARSKGQWREEFPAVWAQYRMDCGKVEKEEELLGDPVPFQREQHLAPTVASRVERILRELLNEGIVVRGRSPYNNALIPKWKGMTLLLTLDCRALDKATPTGPQESLNKNNIVASIPASSRCFSVLCLYNSSFAIPLAQSCWHRFAFTFRHQQFLFTRLPPGFGSTNSILHRRVAQMLSRLEQGQQPWAFNFNGVILVTGRNPEETAARTRRVLELIQQTGFKAKLEKAQLVQTQVEYLGMTISGKGREVPEEKVEELCEEPDPEDAEQLQSLLAKFGAQQDYIPDYWELVLPLHHLTLPGVPWKWQQRQKQQLRELKDALEGKSVLRFPDKPRPFFIRINIHAQTVGSALLQDEGGSLVPVQRFSRMLKGLERSSLVEQSCVVALWAIQAFQPFMGSAPVVLQLPHFSGMFVFRGPALASSGVRPPAPWALLLSEERPERKGQSVQCPAAPPLWQLPADIPKAHVWFLGSHRHRECSVGFAAANLEERWLLGVSRGGSQRDAELEALAELLEQHRSSAPLYLYSSSTFLVRWLGMPGLDTQVCNSKRAVRRRVLGWLLNNPGQLRVGQVGRDGWEEQQERDWMRKVGARAEGTAGRAGSSGNTWWEPSKYERQEIVCQCHGGHRGVVETLARVREVGAWEGARQDVERWVRNCPGCGKGGTEPQRAEGPWSCLSISITGTLPKTTQGFCALLVVRDEFSGWVEAFPLQLKQGREEQELIPLLLREVFGRLGKVGTVRVDGQMSLLGQCLRMSPLWEHWVTLENFWNPPVTPCLFQVAQRAGKEWPEMLPLILAGIRSLRPDRAKLMPLLSIPGLPLEMLWEEQEGFPRDNELSRLGRMRVLPGYREQVGAAIQGEPRTEMG